jgi:hypothetical protein
LKAIIPKVSNRFFIYGIMKSKKEQGKGTSKVKGEQVKEEKKPYSDVIVSVGIGSPPAFPFQRQKPIAFSRSRDGRGNEC